jgi:hypothetical protein
LAITVLFACNAASAAEEMPAIETVRCCTLADAGALPPSNDADRLAPRGRPWRSNALLAGYVGFVSVYGYFAWWNKDVQRHVRAADGTVSTETLPNRTSSFRMASEGGFSRDSVAGGADKLGHAMAFYASTRLLASTLDLWAGQPLHEAIRVAGFASAAVSLAVEVLDGYSLEYGFSTGDLAMNLLGIGAGMLLESSPRLDALIDLRWKYRRSADARWLGDRDPIADYSGHTYLLVLKASGVPQWQSHSWLRYGELHFGYGSRGYAPHPGRFAPVQPRPHRNLYFGVGINLSELLGATVFTGESRARRIADTALEYLQVPGTHLLLRQGLDD